MATLFRMGNEPCAGQWRAPSLTAEQVSGIGAMLATDVIPKLLVAHTFDTLKPPVQASAIEPEEAARVASLAVDCEAHILLEIVEEMMRRDIGVERVFVELLAPAARHLGQEWEVDRLDFMQVSMGLWRLQEVMRELTARSRHAQPTGPNRTALFLACPGENHSFGAAMVQECFALAGWQADLLLEATNADLLDHVAGSSFDLVGLTVSCDCHIERLAATIRAVRSVSMNPGLRLMIGGRVPALDPGLVTRVGADGTAATATDAVLVAERLVDSARLTAVT